MSGAFGEDGAPRLAYGVEIAARPHAIVRAPQSAIVRFAGRLGDEGGIVALEPEAGVLIIFSGLNSAWVAQGDYLRAGAPLGVMGGPQAISEEFFFARGADLKAIPPETLYMEMRREGAPVDPGPWLALANEEGDLR